MLTSSFILQTSLIPTLDRTNCTFFKQSRCPYSIDCQQKDLLPSISKEELLAKFPDNVKMG
jgi:hypothetical protein